MSARPLSRCSTLNPNHPMKLKHMNTKNSVFTAWFSSLALTLLLALALGWPNSAQAASGSWTNTASGGLWSATTNWTNAIVADGATFTASFGNLINITADNTVHLDSPRALTALLFGDTDTASPAGWILDNNGSSANILTLTNTSTITVNALGGTSVATISAVMTGTNSWTKLGASTLNLTGVNTFSNVTVTATGGTLSLNAAGGALPASSTITVNSDAAILDVAQDDSINIINFANAATGSGVGTLTVTNVIRPNIALNKVNNINFRLAGPGAFLKTGQGTTILSASNSYTGGTMLQGANSKLTISGNGTLGSTSGLLIMGPSAAAGTPVILDLGGTSQTVGVATIGNATINNGTLAATSFTVTNGTANAALAGIGTPLTKVSASTFTLAGANTYSGNTTIIEGILALSGSIDNSPVVSVNTLGTLNLLTGAFAVSSGHTLTGAGSVTGGTVTVASGGMLAPGNAGVGTLTVSALILSSGMTNNIEFASPASYDKVNVADYYGLTINGGAINIYQEGTTTPFTQAGVYNLFQYVGGINGAGVSALTVANPQPGLTYSFDSTFDGSGGFVRLTIVSASVVYWNVDADGSWATAGNWMNPVVPNTVGAAPNFGGGGTPITAPRTVTLDGDKTIGTLNFNSAQGFTINPGTPSTSKLTFDNTPNPASIANLDGSHIVSVPVALPAAGADVSVVVTANLALDGQISGSGALAKSAGGTLTLAGVNTYGGGTTVNAGGLTISGSGTLGNTAGQLNANGGILDLGFTSQTVGDVSITGGTIQNGTLTGSSFVSHANPVLGQVATVSANLAGSGALSNLTGILMLSGYNSYSGGTVMSGGLMVVNDDANFGAVPVSPAPANIIFTGGTISNTASYTLHANRGMLIGPTNSAGTVTIETAAGQTATIAGIIANNSGGTNGLNVNPISSGAVILSGANTYTGGTTLTLGALTLQGDQSAANGGFSIGASSTLCAFNIDAGAIVAVASNKTVQIGNPTPNNLGVPTVNVAGSVTNQGSLYVGRLAVLNVNSGANWLQSGDLTVQGAGNPVAVLNVNAGATFTYTGANTIKVNNNGGTFGGTNVIAVAGTLATGQGIQNTVATTGVTASGLTMNNGTLKVTADITNLIFSSSTSPILFTTTGGAASTATIDTGVFNVTNNVGITGNGSLAKLGAGTLTLTATNTYTGNTTIGAGTLVLSGTGSIGSAANLAVNGTLDARVTGFSLNSSRDLSGSGLVLGNLSLANSATTVHPGATNAAGTLTFANNLTLGGTSQAIFDLSSSAVSGNDKVVLTNDSAVLTAAGATITINQLSGMNTLAMADYLLFDLTGASGTVASNFNSTPAWLPAPPANASSYYIATVGKQVFLKFVPLNGNVLTIETAANGSGSLVAAQNVPAGNTVTGYAIERTLGGTFVTNQTVNWSLINLTGGVVAGDMVPALDNKSATFTAHLVGSGQMRAAAPGLLTTNSGILTVVLGAAAQVRVETMPDGTGTLVPAQSLPQYATVTGYAITRDSGGNFIANVAATWSLANVTGGLVSGNLVPAFDNLSATFTAGAVPGSANIRATSGAAASVNSGLITVLRELRWSGNGANWDTTTIANWLLSDYFTQSNFVSGDSVIFDDFGYLNPTVNLVGSLSPLSVKVDGTVILSGNNSGATNGTIVAAGGTLQVGAANNFTAGDLTLTGAGTAATLNLFNNAATDYAKNVTLNGAANSLYTINVDNAGSGTAQTHALPSVSQSSAAVRALTVASGNGYGLTIGNLNLCPGNGQTTTLTANSKVTLLDVSNPMSGYSGGNWDTLTLDGTATDNVVSGSIEDASGLNATNQPASLVNGGTTRLVKNGTGTWTLSGTNLYSGLTTVNAGMLKSGSASAFTGSSSSLTVTGNGVLDLNGFDTAFASAAAGANTGTITDNSASPGTSTLTFTNQGASIATLIKDGPTRKVAVVLKNSNSGTPNLNLASANTFSGGLTLANGIGSGTRLWLTSDPGAATVGAAGAITSGPLGTGPITIGQANTDKAAIGFPTNVTLLNAITVNSALGTDQAGSFRVNGTTNVLYGTLNANLAPATFNGNVANGQVILAGQVTGLSGLTAQGTSPSFTLTLSNTTANANNYAGDTVIATSGSTIALAVADQIPNGAGKGNVVNNGVINLNGFNETINGLSGTGVVGGVSGAPVFTLGDNNATGNTFSGILRNTTGSLSLVKIGTGTQTLSGASTYTGDTIISNGTLSVSSAQTGGGAFAVRDGATLDVARNATTTALAVSSLTLGSINGATNRFTLPAGNPAAQVITAGTLTLNGISAVDIAGSGFTAGQFPLIKYTSKTGSGSFAVAPLNSPAGFTATVSNNVANSSIDLVLVSGVATNPTNISYTISGSNLTLTWPGTHLGWFAQSNAVSLTNPGDWHDVPGSQNATNLNITISPSQPNVFYRLRKP